MSEYQSEQIIAGAKAFKAKQLADLKKRLSDALSGKIKLPEEEIEKLQRAIVELQRSLYSTTLTAEQELRNIVRMLGDSVAGTGIRLGKEEVAKLQERKAQLEAQIALENTQTEVVESQRQDRKLSNKQLLFGGILLYLILKK